MKSKKILWIALVAVDVAITIFLFVIHIVMMYNVLQIQKNPDYINQLNGLFRFLAEKENTTVYLWAFVVPTFVVLVGNIIGLVFYVRRQTKKEKNVKVDDLTDEQKEALKKELLDELNK